MAGKPKIDPQLVVSHEFAETTYAYTEREAVLYALGVGACSKDAVDDKELKYVYHQDGQQAIQAAIVTDSRFDPRLLLHGQQYIEIYKPLPSNGCLLNKAAVVGLQDKGKAAVLEIEMLSYEKESGVLMCMNRLSLYLRGAGGFSKSSQPYSYSKYPPNPTLVHKIPQSQPLAVFEESTQPPQALLYQLSGDYNPLHLDPVVAQIAGFSRPILHGLCTLGFAVRAIIRTICRGDENTFKNISGRFLLHVYPGETLVTEMWLEGSRVIYQVKVKERARVVLSGIVTLHRISSSL